MVRRRLLNSPFKYAVDLKIIQDNPAAGLKAPRESFADSKRAARRKLTYRVWSPEQLRAFVETADQDEFAALWRLTCCGLRRSEVLGLEWSAVDLDAGLVEIRQGRVLNDLDDPKSEASARVLHVETMLPGTVAALRTLKARQAAQKMAVGRAVWPTDLIAVDAAGRPLNRDSYSRAFLNLSQEAGLPRVRLHSVRHTIAPALHDAGVAPATAAGLLGHSLQTHMSVYVQSTDDHQAAAAASFGAVFGVAR